MEATTVNTASSAQRLLIAEQAILNVLSTHQQLDDKALNQALKGQQVGENDKVAALNNLIEANRVLVSVSDKGLPVYRF
jgi:hypothetical protein